MKTKIVIALIAMLSIVACDDNNHLRNSLYDITIDNLMVKCRNFETESLLQGLPGEWDLDSYVVYDDTWQTITSPLFVMGDMICEGLSVTTYIFNVDGTASYSYISSYPPFEQIVQEFTWSYDADNNELIMSGEDYNAQYTVSGFNGEYLVLDYYDSINKHNARKIYKRKG